MTIKLCLVGNRNVFRPSQETQSTIQYNFFLRVNEIAHEEDTLLKTCCADLENSPPLNRR